MLCTHEPKYLNLENECVQYNYLSEIYLFLYYHLCDCLIDDVGEHLELLRLQVADSVNNLLKNVHFHPVHIAS